jgi:DNA-directed RNA polymerase subunit M/transcription elongation factor TFIIS
MHFCKQCSNVLYPMVSSDTLYEYCKNCGYKEENKEYIIYSKKYKGDGTNTMNVRKYLIHDATLPRTIHYKCPNKECVTHTDATKKEAVYYNENGSLKLVYICAACNTEFGI